MHLVKKLVNYIENMTLTNEMMSKLKFINLLFDLEEYFNFWKIYNEEKVWIAFNKLKGESKGMAGRHSSR